MSLKEQALLADQQQREDYKIQREKEREKSLDELIERWAKRWHLRLDEPPPIPARSEFVWETITYGNGRNTRYPTASGWSFTVDDIPFIYSKELGMCVILACPDCGERYADSIYGMADLGKKLKAQRAMFHKCYEVAARELAYALRDAINATGQSPVLIFERALEVMQGWRR